MAKGRITLDKESNLALKAVVTFFLAVAAILILSPLVSGVVVTLQMAITMAVLAMMAILVANILEDVLDDLLPRYGKLMELVVIILLAIIVVSFFIDTVLFVIPISMEIFLIAMIFVSKFAVDEIFDL